MTPCRLIRTFRNGFSGSKVYVLKDDEEQPELLNFRVKNIWRASRLLALWRRLTGNKCLCCLRQSSRTILKDNSTIVFDPNSTRLVCEARTWTAL